MTAFHTIAIPHDDILQGRLIFSAASSQKILLDGFLAGRERIQDEVEKSGMKGRMFE